MQSKTSFFNKSVFVKTVVRFWPLWFIYAAVWLLLMPLGIGSSLRYGADTLNATNNILNSAFTGGLIIGGATAVLAAMAVWSFMYNARSASGTASLPLRRENIFISVTLAGVLPVVAINVLVFLVSVATEALHGVLELSPLLQWLALVTLLYIFFFGFATFCAQLTGSIIVLPIVYVILNFTFIVVEMLVQSIASRFIYGFCAGGNYVLAPLSPVSQMIMACGVRSITAFSAETACYETIGWYFTGWGTICAYAVVGVLFAAAALALFRRRRMETAGDVVAINILKPVFKYCLTAGCAIVLSWLTYQLTFELYSIEPGRMPQALAMTAYMIVGGAIGYFAAEMLIRKSFRVFSHGWTGLCVCVVLIIAFMMGIETDVLGIERCVPDAEDVESVSLIYGDATVLRQSDNIEDVIAMHEGIIANKDYHELHSNELFSQYLNMTYILKNGRSISRTYNLVYTLDNAAESSDVLALQNIANCTEAILQRKDTGFEFTQDNIFSASIDAWASKDEYIDLEGEDKWQAMVAANYSKDYYGVERDYDAAAISAADTTYTYMGSEAEPTGTNYSWPISSEDAYELFTTCILPDIEDGTLGRIWLIEDEDYQNTVYSANISIEARILKNTYADGSPRPDSQYVYDYFTTVPTVDSVRTNAWLEAHGVNLRTVGEVAALETEADSPARG